MKTISFIVCTYNSGKLISRCLDSILRQKYSGKKEIIVVDGGSIDNTLKILEEYKKKHKIIILDNKKKLPEGKGFGKWLGWKKAKGDFIAIVDHDNELRGENWINDMLEPFSNKEVFGAACRVVLKKQDSLTNQYIALQGTDPFMAYRSLDSQLNLRKIGRENKDYILIRLNKNNLLITGGNCFVYRKKYLDNLGGYTKDVENISKIVNTENNIVGVPKKALTHHLAISGFLDFIRKKKKWAKAYTPDNSGFSYFPRTRIERRNFLLNLFYIFIILPNIYIAFRQIVKTREKAWILHPILCFITGFIYGFYNVRKINYIP